MKTAYYELKSIGFDVESLGLFEDDYGDIEKADFVLTGVPTSRDGLTVNCPITKKYIWLEDIDETKKDITFISAGYIFKKHKTVDLLKLDDFCILNGVPTAEGAIAFAIQNSDFTLWKSNIMVIGNGRVAKILIDRLKGFNCRLTVSARKNLDFAFLDSFGLKYIKTAEISRYIPENEIIFNTVDIRFDDSEASSLKNKLIIDLSTVGCLDAEQIKKYNINYHLLPGIPGKIAPVTAGKIIAETTARIIEA